MKNFVFIALLIVGGLSRELSLNELIFIAFENNPEISAYTESVIASKHTKFYADLNI